jgi:hypothetical protein
VIAFDTTYLIVLLQEKAVPSITDRQGKPVSKARERVQYLVQKLSESNSIICIPTPVLAEIMVRAGSAGPEYLRRFNDSSKFRLSAFDVRAAIEAAELIRLVKDEQSKRAKIDTWAKMKFDLQIVAIAKAESCGAIYSDDPNIENHGKRVNIPVRRICDLQLPPESDGESQQPDLFRALKETETSEVRGAETALIKTVANLAAVQANEKVVKREDLEPIEEPSEPAEVQKLPITPETEESVTTVVRDEGNSKTSDKG